MINSVFLRVFFVGLVLLALTEAKCPRFRWGDPECPVSLSLPLTFNRVISPEEFRQRACCAQKALSDPDGVVFVEPQFTELSSARNTPLYPNAYNPYQTASQIVIAGRRVFISASGSWDTVTGQQIPDGVERVNRAYDWQARLARALGLGPESFVQLTILNRGTDLSLFSQMRDRANNITTSLYGSVQVTLPGREYIGCNWVEGQNVSQPNTFATVAEYWLGCSGMERWNLPCNVTQGIPTIVTQTPETFDERNAFLTNRIRAFVQAVPNTCNWVQPPLADRAKVAFDNLMTREGPYLNNQTGLVGKVTADRVVRIEIWTQSYANYSADVFAKIIQYFGPDKYPVFKFMQVPNLATGDIFEAGLTYWTGQGDITYNVNQPFEPFGPYSNAIRAGDYVYTSAFGGHHPSNRSLVAMEDRVRQAYSNMLAAAAVLGAGPEDLAAVEAVTTDLVRDQPLVDQASREFFGINGPFPTRAFHEQPALYYGQSFEVSGLFYAPLCRR